MLPFVLVLELGKLQRGEQMAGGHSLVGVGSVPGRRRTHTGVPVDLVLEARGGAKMSSEVSGSLLSDRDKALRVPGAKASQFLSSHQTSFGLFPNQIQNCCTGAWVFC